MYLDMNSFLDRLPELSMPRIHCMPRTLRTPQTDGTLVAGTTSPTNRTPAGRRLTTALRSLLLALTVGSLTACVVVEEEPEPEPQPSHVKRMFASNQLVSGNLGGVTGADAACASWAAAADLGGTWKAFLSTKDVPAPHRIAETGPWYNVTRQYKVFNNKSGFTVGAITPVRTEYNTPASGYAWTGTRADGTADVVTCGDWTSSGPSSYATAGMPSGTLGSGAVWMSRGGNAPACADALRVYCFEQ